MASWIKSALIGNGILAAAMVGTVYIPYFWPVLFVLALMALATLLARLVLEA